MSYGKPTELDPVGCQGLYIENCEKTNKVAKLERVARAAKAYQSITLEHWARNYTHPDDHEDVRRDLSEQLIDALADLESDNA